MYGGRVTKILKSVVFLYYQKLLWVLEIFIALVSINIESGQYSV